MKKHDREETDSNILRRKAEDLLKIKNAKKYAGHIESDVLKLVHELQVYQIELEIQNEELALAKKQAAVLAAEKYAELYDFAPSGYFTLSKYGRIKKINFSGAAMLSKERSRLTGNPMSYYMSDETKPVFDDFLNAIFKSSFKQTCEVTFLIKGKSPINVHLSGVISASNDECLVTATDITSRIQAEELLRQNEAALSLQNELFSSLLKNLQTGVFMVEAPTGKPLLANEKALELLGRGILPDANKYNLAEVYKAFKAGSRIPYPPDEMPVLLGINGKSAHIDDMIVIRPDGSEILLEISGTPVKDKKGNVWASLVSFMDITERKKAEAAIRLSEEKFRTVADFTYDWENWRSPDGNFRYVSPSCERITGYTADEFIANSQLVIQITHPEDQAMVIEHYNKKNKENENSDDHLDFRIITKDGQIRWINHYCTSVYDESGKQLGERESNRDITERKRADEALKQSEKHFRELADSITDVFFEMDTDLRYTYWNKASEKLLGISAELAIGKSIHKVFPNTSDIALAENVYREVVKSRKPHIFESVFEYNDNHLVFEVRVYPTERGISVFTTDISERKKAEAEIKIKNDELLKTNAEKDKFFSILAHDLRSPFNAFLGLTQVMEEELPSLTLDDIKTFAVSMRKSANMLFLLLENLLEWSRMQRGLISFQPKACRLSSEVEANIELVRDAAKKKMIEIRQVIPDNLIVNVDTQMLESLLRNLIFNAIKFTPQKGKVTIKAKMISGTMVEISLSDTGIGMDQHLISKLFQVDEQTHRKGTEGEPSTGLGLVICKDFVEKHGGKIWAESIVGKGSTFHFTIPCEKEIAINPKLKNRTPSIETLNNFRKLKVLIIEDDEISRMLISAALNPFSKELLVTRNGTEAVEITKKNPDLDLIMMDIQIPGIDGYEATRQIRQFNKDVIIIAQTAFGPNSDSEKAVKSGCNDYISKPLNIPFLKGLIQKYFSK